MLQLLDQFFDRAIFYATLGYEEACVHTEGNSVHAPV